jgi:hypothetical protein
MNRALGDHVIIHGCAASMKLHNKIWFNESDIRTHLASDWQRKNVDGPDSLEGTLEVLKREFAHILCNSVYGFWFEMEEKWYKAPDILSLFETIQKISKQSLALNRKSNSEIAVLIDDISQLYSLPTVREALLREQRIHELCRIGAMPDYYFLSDLNKMPLDQYKMFIFLNSFVLDKKTKQDIDKLKNGNKTLVWLYAPGIIKTENHKGKAFCKKDMEELTGFKYEYMSKKQFPSSLEIVENSCLDNVEKGYVFGKFFRDIKSGICGGPEINRKIPPLKLICNVSEASNVIPLGRYENMQEKIGFALKKCDNWNSIFIGSIYPSAKIWRAIAKNAGVHLYSDHEGDIIYQNESFLCIHVKEKGTRNIKLRHKADVINVFTNEEIGENVNSFSINMKEKSSMLFFLGSKKNWRSLTK